MLRETRVMAACRRRMVRPNAIDRLRPLRRAVRGAEVALVVRTGRSVVSRLARTPVLVLETVGRRSGAPRRSVVAYHRLDGGDLLVVGGAAGQTRVPDWIANLRARPEVHVVVDRHRQPVIARELAGAERAEHWQRATELWPRIEIYQRRAGRPVPVFLLTPASDDAPGWPAR